MYNLTNFAILTVMQSDVSDLITFLSLPEIDLSFVSPLSSRKISIEERVKNKFQSGFWLLAKYRERIVGCRGCVGITDMDSRIVDFSTTVVSPQFRGIGLGTELVLQSIRRALDLYNPLLMRIDSWDTNKAMRQIALNAGFVKYRTFEDPDKRPEGLLSVEYLLDCTKIRR